MKKFSPLITCEIALNQYVCELMFGVDIFDLNEECNTSITTPLGSSAGIPSMRKPASRETSSASVELCETEVRFLHIQLIGTNV